MKGSKRFAALLVVALVAIGCARGDEATVDAPAVVAPDGAPVEPFEEDDDLPEVDTSGWDVAADLAAIQRHFDALAAAFDDGSRAGFAALGASHRPQLTAEQYLECFFGEGETFANLDAEGYRLRMVWSALEPDPDFLGSDDVRVIDEGFRVYFGEYVEYETFDGEEDAFEFSDSVAIHPDGRVVLFTCDLGDGI